MVVELFPNWFECFRDISVVDEPRELRIAFAGDDDFGLKTVSMQATTFMRSWQVRQQMGGFELKGLAEFD
jgi:hypothetical protein